MMSYVNATDGIAYTNMDVVDNRIYLTVGCIQVVFVNKFVSSILVSYIFQILFLSIKITLSDLKKDKASHMGRSPFV